MLLECDGCGEKVSSCAKMPIGFMLEFMGKRTKLIIPEHKLEYRNICKNCLIEQSEESDE
jgi:Fe2+ or Zn2+ uptake regulation protein